MASLPFQFPGHINWLNPASVEAETFICGYCGDKVSSDRGYIAHSQPPQQSATLAAYIRICPGCKSPSVFFRATGKRYPGVAPGQMVPYLPPELEKIYAEARQSAAAGAFTASVLVCRKMLMNVAVSLGAKAGDPFVSYVAFLADNGYVPPQGRGWVDYIRRRGNEATHEIALMEEKDAVALLQFVEMLLRFIYEFPQLVPPTPSATPGP